jgi:hypothetical protein
MCGAPGPSARYRPRVKTILAIIGLIVVIYLVWQFLVKRRA